MMRLLSPFLLLALALASVSAQEDNFTALCADRASLERIYHEHRLGQKQPFEEALPLAQLERLVRRDQNKQSILRRVYGVEITPAQLAAEEARISATTRAPDILTKLRQALGNDSTRFAETLVRPLLVDRELLRRFETDDALHASERRKCEASRVDLLAGKAVDGLNEITWQLTPRPAEEGIAPATFPTPTQPIRVDGTTKDYTVEGTVQFSQVLTSPAPAESARDAKYFSDLNPHLKKVLHAQLREPGDVSAVIETSTGFLVFIARERTPESLSVGVLAWPKLSYETWLNQQTASPSP